MKNPLDILGKEGVKVQSLTVSDQHATLLITHQQQLIAKEGTAETNDNDDQATTTTTITSTYTDNNVGQDTSTITSLLKLTLQPFHKEILGSNPVISQEDIDKGQIPERNLLDHNPITSEEIISFLNKYTFELKSESGAEYSYHSASPNSNSADTTKQDESSGSISNAISKFGCFDVELISPASPYQISRAMPTLGHVLINETYHMYSTVVQPYIQSIIDSGSLSWINNVVEGKKEAERLLVNHEEFVINVDTKWRTHPPPLTTPRSEWYNHPSTSDLYCLGIVKDSSITCIRDLRGHHIPLLKAMVKEGLAAIKSTYGVQVENQIRIFVHYQPQFYHFHIHFTRLENEVGCSVERGHLVSDIIQNIEMDSQYYVKRMLTYKLKKGSPLENLIATHISNDEGESVSK